MVGPFRTPVEVKNELGDVNIFVHTVCGRLRENNLYARKPTRKKNRKVSLAFAHEHLNSIISKWNKYSFLTKTSITCIIQMEFNG